MARHLVEDLEQAVFLLGRDHRRGHDLAHHHGAGVEAGGDHLVAQVAVGHDADRLAPVIAGDQARNALLAHHLGGIDHLVLDMAGDQIATVVVPDRQEEGALFGHRWRSLKS